MSNLNATNPGAFGNLPAVSVIVPVRDGGEQLRACLRSIAANSPAPHEVIVVADGSPSDLTTARSLGAQALATGGTIGPAAARNLGARTASGEVLYFLDADVTVRPNAIGRVAHAFRTDPDLAALFGSYDDEPSETNIVSQYKNLLHHHVHQTAREDACTFWSGSGAIRREVFLHLGGFDARFARASIEDIELGYRLKRSGHRIRLCRDLQVKHHKRYTLASLVRSDVLDRAVPWSRLILRERRLPSDLNLRPSRRLSAALAVAALTCLVAAPFSARLLALFPAIVVPLVLLDRSFYALVLRKRGALAALAVVPLHWFHYLYSTLAFLFCAAELALASWANPGWRSESA